MSFFFQFFSETSPCTNNPCKNGGTCSTRQSDPKGYTCACPTGYTGQYNCSSEFKNLIFFTKSTLKYSSYFSLRCGMRVRILVSFTEFLWLLKVSEGLILTPVWSMIHLHVLLIYIHGYDYCTSYIHLYDYWTDHYSVIVRNSCGGQLAVTDSVGQMASPYWPSNYHDSSRCTWTFTAPPDSNIVLSFEFFDTESCCDCLTFYPGEKHGFIFQGASIFVWYSWFKQLIFFCPHLPIQQEFCEEYRAKVCLLWCRG